MKETAIFYGSTSGNCEGIANKIAEALGVSNVFSASELDAAKIAAYENLLFGSSTWGSGDLQDEWYDGVEVIKSSDLSGKTVAVFGCGDSSGFSTTYCDAIGQLYEAAKAAGANIVGAVSTDGYTFDESSAVVDGKFVGLALDEDNESDKTDGRIAAWVEEIKPLL
jgi:flavodoxin, long chain